MDGQSMNCGKRSVKSGSRRRKNGERVTAVFLAGCILFSLAGCGMGGTATVPAGDEAGAEIVPAGSETAGTQEEQRTDENAGESAVPDAAEDITDAIPLHIIDDNYRTYYEVFVYSFYDSDGDGIGDLQGLISQLDYINDGDDATDTDF